jgi:hypothetical protein
MKLPESCAEVLLSPEADTTDLNSQAFINNDVMLTFIQDFLTASLILTS